MSAYRFATAERPVLPMERASVHFDGLFTEPRLQHPEGLAVGPGGTVWCGSENGEILKIAPDGSSIERVASTGGFILGLAFNGRDALFACDLKHAAVFRLSIADGRLERFTPPGIRIPNYPVVDARHGRLLVSDSHAFGTPGPGVWAYDLATGAGSLWYAGDLDFANGMALTPGGGALLVCETFARRVSRIGIGPDGAPGPATVFADDLPGLPDGLAVDEGGTVFVSCYEPSRILRVPADGGPADVYIEDPTAHLFAHPTNIAFDEHRLYAANLGRWHITRIEADTRARPLWSESDVP
jgi:sugar lactone lactonase YvrE